MAAVRAGMVPSSSAVATSRTVAKDRLRAFEYLRIVERDGETLELVVRGDRTDMPLIFPLRHEMTLQSLLHDRDIPVPAVHGWIDEPMAYVMDRVGGQQHFENTSDADRHAAQLFDILDLDKAVSQAKQLVAAARARRVELPDQRRGRAVIDRPHL